ncbi:poly(R)-hydroxyalkanoic acid synthase subunit PhaE [Dyella silvae]|uniref:poly(R)-hydroxyalkanoic acid synthase subunit PhaE n=1 Tax=Dyella silvae TaxID=2994424 RepID=UPI002263EC0C|nr:poly(R)-hydroxyalkanoic acid synthase subunit PhaE [Dyella silvae]
MADQASDLLRDYQALAQHSWDAWTRYLQQQSAPSYAAHAASTPHYGAGDDVLARSMAALKGYGEWLHGAIGSGLGQAPADWQQSLQSLFSNMGGQPFAHAFGSLDSDAARSFTQMWQSWMQANPSMAGGFKFDVEHMAAFGYTRERQLQQQALLAAMQDYLAQSNKYQALIQRANNEGFERLQAKLAELADAKRQVESLKGLYDLWVDAAEEAYAQIALSEEFRQAYGEMVNAQSRVRQLQQEQLEAMCAELGMPTRSEVMALGKRMHELRREVRANAATGGTDEIAALRAEVAALKRQLTGKPEQAKAAAKKAPARSSKREQEKEAVVRRAKPAAAVVARKSVVRGATRTRK